MKPCTKYRLPLICTASIALFGLAVKSHATLVVKADNLNNLDQITSWLLGALPGAGDIAQWDSTVATVPAPVLLGSDQSWGGIKIVNPAGPVTISAGSTLTLGKSGIDMSAATQNLTLNNAVTLLGNTNQTWTVASGKTLQLNGTLTRTDGVIGGTRSTINFDTSAGGTINIASGTASTVWNYATLNKTDFAALDASKNIVAGATVGTYTANPATGAANPNLTGTFTFLDFINSNTTAGQTGVRIGSSTNITISSGGGMRFNTPHATGLTWTIDLAGRNLNVSGATILVTPNVGAGNVEINGAGNIRLGTNVDLTLIQHNTAGSLIVNGAITQSGTSTGPSAVTKSGAGLVILAGANAYFGVTRILEGTLQVGNNGIAGVLGSLGVIDNGTLAFNRTDNIVIANAISGTGQVSQLGSGTLSLSGANTYTGATNFNAGTTTFTALANFGSGTALNFGTGKLQWSAANTTDISARTVTFNGASTLDTNGNNVTLANAIGNSGAGGFTKAGAGTITLGGANSYAGTTAITTGKLLANNTTGSATGTGPVNVGSGATLGGTGFITGAVTVSSGGILSPGASVESLDLGALTLSASTLLTYEFASISSYDRTNVLNLNGLTINGGAISLLTENTATPWSTAGNYDLFSYTGTLGGTGIGSLSVANQQGGYSYTFSDTGTMVRLNIATLGLISNWTFDGSGSWNTAGRWNAAVPGSAGDTARFITALTAAAGISLDGSKTVGSLVFDSAAFGYTITPGTGGTLTINNSANPGAIQVLSGSQAISAPITLTATNTNVTVATASALALSGAVDGAGSLTKIGAGSLTLTGVNSYAGGTAITGGVVEFNALAALGTGSIGVDTATLRWLGNTDDVSTRTVTFGSGGATLDTNGNNVTLTNAVGNSGAGSLTKTGLGKLTLLAANPYTGATTINGGTLAVSANDQLGTPASGAGITINGATLATSATFALDNAGANARALTIGSSGATLDIADLTILTHAGTVSSSTGTLNKTGPGTLLLTGNSFSTFNGPRTLTAGIVELGGGQPNGQQAIGIGAITFNGGTLKMNGTTADNVAGYGTLTNALIIPATQTGTLNMTVRGAITSAVTGSGIFNLVVNYTRGDWNGNASAFTGNFNVLSDPATLNAVDDFRVTNGFGFPKLNLGFGVFAYQNFNPPSTGALETIQPIGELSGAVGAILSGNPVGGRYVNWTVGALNTDSTYAGIIQDTPASGLTTGNLVTPGQARLTKVGTGVLTLTGANTLTGATAVNGGKLLVNGSLSGSAVTVAANAALGGSGTLGVVTANSGGTLSPGNSPGILNTGNVVFNSGAIFNVELSGPIAGTQYDQLNVIGTVNLNADAGAGSTLTLSLLNGYAPNGNRALHFITINDDVDPVTGVFANTVPQVIDTVSYNTITVGSDLFAVSYNGDSVGNTFTGGNDIALMAIPEPGSIALIAGGLGGLLGRRRRRSA